MLDHFQLGPFFYGSALHQLFGQSSCCPLNSATPFQSLGDLLGGRIIPFCISLEDSQGQRLDPLVHASKPRTACSSSLC